MPHPHTNPPRGGDFYPDTGGNAQHAAADEGLAIDGKTLCHAIDDDGRQTHVLGVVGHQSQTCYTQKKSVPCP